LRNAARATTGSGRDDRIPHDHLGQPDLQALVRQCGGFDKIRSSFGPRGIAPTPNGRSAVVPDSKHRPSRRPRCPIKRHRSTKAEVEARREALLDIIEAGRPMTVRQVFYQATVRGLVEKAESGYVKVQTDLTLMRRAGELPYDWLADNTRWQRKPRTFNGVEEALKATAAFYRKNLWAVPTHTSRSGWRRMPSQA
jgi:hypothetical protein